jgi:hypothetical protein
MNPLAVRLLAQSDSAKFGAGAVSLVVLLLMGVATALLVRNMNGRLKRLPTSIPVTDDNKDADGASLLPPTASPGGATSAHPRDMA